MTTQTRYLTPDDIIRLRELALPGNQVVSAIIAEVCAETGFKPAAVRSASRRPDVVGARWIVMYRARQQGLSLKCIGACLSLDHSTVAHGINREKQRRGEV